MRRLLLIVLSLLIGIPALYIGVAFGLAILTPKLELPRGSGITIYACDNGVHTDLVLPVKTADVDWRHLLPDAFPGQFDPEAYLSFGWGSRDFYINTPTWSDVRITTTLKAVLWDETVVHVDYRPKPRPGETCGFWVVGTRDYRRIVEHVLDSVRGMYLTPRPRPIAPGYGPTDVFYAGEGQYTVVDTCNQWTGRALRASGTPVAAWTPFSFLVLWNMPMISN
jgi:uncharacterized protein (TIGR02117 family)